MYEARVGNGVSQEDRLKLIFTEIQGLEEEIRKKSVETSCKSNIFWWINTLLNVTVIISSAIITVITSIFYPENVPSIILGAVIFIISGINQLLKLGDRGYEYFKGNFRFRRIRQQVRDILYMFQNYTAEQLLAYISSIRVEVDEIDMDLYRASMTGEAKFDNGLRIAESGKSSNPIIPDISSQNLREQNTNSQPQTPSHIHIHIDTTPNSSPPPSPASSPRSSPMAGRDSLGDNSLEIYSPN